MTHTRWAAGQRGQVLPFMAISLVFILGMVAMIIDAGIFMVSQRQLQSAADAAALAGVWYEPVCRPGPPVPLGTMAPNDPRCMIGGSAVNVADDVVRANMAPLTALCGMDTSDSAYFDVTYGVVDGEPVQIGQLTVNLKCDGHYLFGVILNLVGTTDIKASAAAAIGRRDQVFPLDSTGFHRETPPPACGTPYPPPCIYARLIQ